MIMITVRIMFNNSILTISQNPSHINAMPKSVNPKYRCPGVLQDSCPFYYATFSSFISAFLSILSGFSHTPSTGFMHLIPLLQRSGCFALAALYTAFLATKMSASSPLWREAGVTNCIPLCR